MTVRQKWDLYALRDRLSDAWETFWLCRVRHQHHEKLGSHRACYRCGKAMR